MTALVVGLLLIWLVLSAANQIPGPWTASLGKVGMFALLPANGFFAPDPIDVDYHLVFRDFLENDEAGPWREIPAERDGPFRMFWSTAKRDHQAILAAVSGLGGIQQFVAPLTEDPESLIQISLPYLFLLHRVLAEPRTPGAKERQFMIAETRGFGELRRMELSILSNPHRFD
jgi:hypothetical protein